MDYSENFLEIIPEHIRREGGDRIVDHPLDPGKLTKYGVAQAFHPGVDVRNLTLEGAYEFFYGKFWIPMRLDQIEDMRISAEMFDQGAGPNGMGVAVKSLQASLILLGKDLNFDGWIGDITIGAANSYPYPEDLAKCMNCCQFVAFLFGSRNIDEIRGLVRERLPQLQAFLRGWLKRIDAA